MEQWQDQAIILSARTHGENGAVISLLTRENGKQAGYMRGASSQKHRGTIELGNIVDANWRSRTHDGLGSLNLELSHSSAARIMHDPLKLSALQSACSICDQALPDKEGGEGLYNGLSALLNILETDVWAQAYIMWEIALLKELGFALDLTKCAAGGDASTLAYVSPKTGRAVSEEAAQPYKDKLLPLPDFLKPQKNTQNTSEELQIGLQLTRFFLEHWVFAHHNRGLPEARSRLDLRFAEVFAKKDGSMHERNTNELGTELYVTG